jgi:hypothetical protein
MDALREVHFLFQQMPHFANISGWSFLLVHFNISVPLKKNTKDVIIKVLRIETQNYFYLAGECGMISNRRKSLSCKPLSFCFFKLHEDFYTYHPS